MPLTHSGLSMPAALMDGRAAAQLVKDGLRAEVQRLGAAAPP
eukprot:COSAG01_NODE_25639_length_738_cov_2.439750_1_plen_41_part_10